MEISVLTDVGRIRSNNEDSYFVYRNELLAGAMVADGMGGENCGEIASKMAADLIKQYIISNFDPKMDYMEMAELMRIAFINANRQIYEYSQKSPDRKGMGTTATLAFYYDNKLLIAHVGDSRCYKVKNNKIELLTEDHSFVGELMRAGSISEEMARTHPNRNMITRVLGVENSVKVEIYIKSLDDETILLSTDGLTNMLSDSQIAEILERYEKLDDALGEMLTLANKKGGNDNITIAAFKKLKGEAKNER